MHLLTADRTFSIPVKSYIHSFPHLQIIITAQMPIKVTLNLFAIVSFREYATLSECKVILCESECTPKEVTLNSLTHSFQKNLIKKNFFFFYFKYCGAFIIFEADS